MQISFCYSRSVNRVSRKEHRNSIASNSRTARLLRIPFMIVLNGSCGYRRYYFPGHRITNLCAFLFYFDVTITRDKYRVGVAFTGFFYRIFVYSETRLFDPFIR